ncbi:hypothetical protein [Rossellomorea sp. SC111]|uniref:hypothetical protein n=1 Tax=Rossellomorea sp. SC111 TaxID=2968985 RepID=UPI00215A1311|nr:hypothetical protein [Rossellomorea sp. SC111]
MEKSARRLAYPQRLIEFGDEKVGFLRWFTQKQFVNIIISAMALSSNMCWLVMGTAALSADVRPSLLSFASGVSALPFSAGVYEIPFTIYIRYEGQS